MRLRYRRDINRLVLGIVAMVAGWGLVPLAAADGVDLYFIDVMGGAATLIVTPEKESILIDTGWPGQEDRDPLRIIHVLKDVAGCDHIDHLFTTHWHVDHFGGVGGLAKRVEIRHFYDRGLPEDNAAGLDFPDGPKPSDPLGIAYRKAAEGKRRALRAGDLLPFTGGLSAVVLAASGTVLQAPPNLPANRVCSDSIKPMPVDHSDNARSLALRFRFGKFEFLDCGDLTWNVEHKLVCPSDLIGPIDLYQVTHHGMDISNHPTLLETIAPTVTIMNNGPRKGGSPATVKRLQGVSSIQAAYQLHRNVESAPEENAPPERIANPDRAGGQYIHVSVSPEGARFSVQIGADGPKQEFSSK